MKQNILTIQENSVIWLGYVGDESSTIVRIPVSSFISKYGQGGVFELIHMPPGESEGHPVADIDLVDGYVEWLVKSGELINCGSGEVQLAYVCDDGVAHTKIWKTVILRSLSDTSDTPLPWQSWVDKLYEYKQDAEEASRHYPYINPQTRTWYVWNVEQHNWEDTHVSAAGKAQLPDDGEVGQVLTKTEDSYEWADPQGAGVQADWSQNDSESSDYIKNKPFESLSENSFDIVDGVVTVKVTDDAVSGSMLPITSSGVNTIVGNIDVLLSLI